MTSTAPATGNAAEDEPDTLAMLRRTLGGDVLCNTTTGRYLSDHIEELFVARKNIPKLFLSDWLDEVQGASTRREHLLQDIKEMGPECVLRWMEMAYSLGVDQNR